MANMINLEGVPHGFMETGKQILEELKGLPTPEVLEKMESVQALTKVTAEDMPKFLPEIIKNDFEIAERVCSTGRAVHECAKEINRISHAAGIAVLTGGLALGIGFALYLTVQQQKEKIKKMEETIEALNARTDALVTIVNRFDYQ